MMNKMFIEGKSKFGYDETVEVLSKAITDGGWGIQHTHNLQGQMSKKGLEVLPAMVIELCKPEYAYKLLSKDDTRIITTMMPCRLSIYEKSDGKTYVSRMNNGLMAKEIGGIVEEVMGGAYQDVEKFLQTVLE